MDCTHLIERLEAFEERMGVRLEALFAHSNNKGYTPPGTYLKICGELHPREGSAIQQKISLVVDVYDDVGRLVGGNSRSFSPEDFFGFETFEINTHLEASKLKISKIRLYPKSYR